MVQGFILAVFGLAVARVAWMDRRDRVFDWVLNICQWLIAAFLLVMAVVAFSGILKP